MDQVIQFDEIRDLCPAEIEVLILTLKSEGYTIANCQSWIVYPVSFIEGYC